ncbi:MAG: EscU/YscU/HrcU family type III secretion system export apparatus switch protein [Treponema sp.]
MNKKVKTAIALKYPANADAPFITAKEKGALAQRMIEIARENNIPLVEDKVLTNVLTVQEIGKCIPEETWSTVAKIFAYIQKVENENAERFYKN